MWIFLLFTVFDRISRLGVNDNKIYKEICSLNMTTFDLFTFSKLNPLN